MSGIHGFDKIGKVFSDVKQKIFSKSDVEKTGPKSKAPSPGKDITATKGSQVPKEQVPKEMVRVAAGVFKNANSDVGVKKTTFPEKTENLTPQQLEKREIAANAMLAKDGLKDGDKFEIDFGKSDKQEYEIKVHKDFTIEVRQILKNGKSTPYRKFEPEAKESTLSIKDQIKEFHAMEAKQRETEAGKRQKQKPIKSSFNLRNVSHQVKFAPGTKDEPQAAKEETGKSSAKLSKSTTHANLGTPAPKAGHEKVAEESKQFNNFIGMLDQENYNYEFERIDKTNYKFVIPDPTNEKKKVAFEAVVNNDNGTIEVKGNKKTYTFSKSELTGEPQFNIADNIAAKLSAKIKEEERERS